MNSPERMDHEDVLRARVQVLKAEHRDLDQAIAALEATGRSDALTLRRLKKRKLMLKDEIAALEDEIFPDIIA